MRVIVGSALLALSCSDPSGLTLQVYAGSPEVVVIQVATSDLSCSSTVNPPGFDDCTNGLQPDNSTTKLQGRIRFVNDAPVVTTAADVPPDQRMTVDKGQVVLRLAPTGNTDHVHIALVGLDANNQPVTFADVQSNGIPDSPTHEQVVLAAAGSAVYRWTPQDKTLPYSCLAITDASVDNGTTDFFVPSSDPDCDGELTAADDCDAYAWAPNGSAEPVTDGAGSCATTGAVGSGNACLLGENAVCVQGVGVTDANTCNTFAPPACLPSPACQLCPSGFGANCFQKGLSLTTSSRIDCTAVYETGSPLGSNRPVCPAAFESAVGFGSSMCGIELEAIDGNAIWDDENAQGNQGFGPQAVFADLAGIADVTPVMVVPSTGAVCDSQLILPPDLAANLNTDRSTLGYARITVTGGPGTVIVPMVIRYLAQLQTGSGSGSGSDGSGSGSDGSGSSGSGSNGSGTGPCPLPSVCEFTLGSDGVDDQPFADCWGIPLSLALRSR